MMYLDVYEDQLLRAQERSMVQQGRILAAALSDQADDFPDQARDILVRLRQRTQSRLRIVDARGWLIADSSLLGPRRESSERTPIEEKSTRESWLYRVGAGIYRAWSQLFERRQSSQVPTEYYSPDNPLLGQEVRDALAGRYGAVTRLITGQGSVTLYSAIPVRKADEVIGAVLVSQSTSGVLDNLVEVRLAIFKVFLASVGVAVVLSLLVSRTIARPLKRLRREAVALLDRRGRLKGRFTGSDRADEFGDLARSLEETSRRLEESIGFMESFAADVSHEFKNPLASIRNATEMLSEVETPEERQRFLDVALAEIARMESLLSTVREITTIDSQLEEEETSVVALKDVIEGVVEGVRHRDGKGIIFSLVFTDAEVSVRASPERLVQVFENILENAVSFSPKGGTVTVRLQNREASVMATIHDEGPGIPAEHLSRIFQRFFSYRPAGDSSTAKHKHTGLGLAIVKAIVEGYGGRISAQNLPEGGATFEVALPSASS
jgi:two-component system sensor histidine kinase ChvG